MNTLTTDDAATALLHDVGLKTTAPRRAVLAVLWSGGHFEAADIFERIRDSLPGTSLQAVYGVLGSFVAAGIVRKIEAAGGSALFEIHGGDNHHHVQCTACGRIEDVPCVVGEAPCLTPPSGLPYAIEVAEVTFKGLCLDCQSPTS